MPINPQSLASHVASLGPSVPLIQQMDYDEAGRLLYLGKANPGTAPGESLWQIRRFSYDGSGNLTEILYAQNGAFLNAWTNRAGLSYS